jgi:hypothetical protein
MHSEIILVKNCLKRGLGNVCAYPDPETEQQHDRAAAPGMSAHYTDPSIIYQPPQIPLLLLQQARHLSRRRSMPRRRGVASR